MEYVLAVVGVILIVVLLWRFLAPNRVGAGARRRPMAPDDDADFLRRLGEQIKRGDDGDRPAGG
ncbi:MAG TPA: hypothetical protein VHX38_27150 [Pseudonocardiaceae bacterium]|jgi:hypothetical protein|nr:hypothetical protein [Pseudonocardiaceae bacterium]